MNTQKNNYIVASAFSSAGIGMQGYKDAGFIPAFALEKNEQAAKIFDANHRYIDGSSVMNVKDVNDISGRDILDFIEQKTGSRVVHLFEQGPSCQDYTKLNTVGTDRGLRELMLKAIKLVGEVEPLTAVIEEVPDFLNQNNKDISDEYFEIAKGMNYYSAYMVVNSIHYQSHQARTRFIHIFVRKDLGIAPVFPTPVLDNPTRVKDFLDIDWFHSGHFSDIMKSKYHFMCTVTSGSPKWFYKGDIKREPTKEELMKCMDLPPNFKLVANDNVWKLALGNGIPAMLTYHIGKALKENVLDVYYSRV